MISYILTKCLFSMELHVHASIIIYLPLFETSKWQVSPSPRLTNVYPRPMFSHTFEFNLPYVQESIYKAISINLIGGYSVD